MPFTLRSRGPLPTGDVTLWISMPSSALVVDSIDRWRTCTQAGCRRPGAATLGALAPGASRVVRLRVRGDAAGVRRHQRERRSGRRRLRPQQLRDRAAARRPSRRPRDRDGLGRHGRRGRGVRRAGHAAFAAAATRRPARRSTSSCMRPACCGRPASMNGAACSADFRATRALQRCRPWRATRRCT